MSSSSKSRIFEPSYIWKHQSESSEKRGILSRMLGLKPDEKIGKNKCRGKYQELNEHSEDSEKQESGTLLKIISSADGKFTFYWRSGNEKIKKVDVSEVELIKLFLETLQKSNNRLGELFLCLGKGNQSSGFLMTQELSQISVRKLYMRLETLEMLEWWMKHISPIGLSELNISPHGDRPIDLPSKFFELPHFRVAQIIRLMEHCSFTADQFIFLCSSASQFSFYSDTISEDVVKTGIGNKMNSMNCNGVIEWFFTRKVNTEDVIHEMVRPSCERKEIFSPQKQCFEPVDVYPVPNENNKRISLMIVKDPSDDFKTYSLILFS